jgi:putative acetyltransferase
MDTLHIRAIQQPDNKEIASIIRATFREYHIDRPGTAYYDSSLDTMDENFRAPGSGYLIGLLNGRVSGGGGIYPSPGLPPETCELVKMYLDPAARGKGLGRQLMDECLRLAGAYGYRQVYLETFPELQKAISLYEKYGFRYLDAPMGNTGHYECSVWMLKELAG